MKPPFRIYTYTDIADAEGHVCTAEDAEIARQILFALVATYGSGESPTALTPAETKGKIA